jgi:hypothetical protein
VKLVPLHRAVDGLPRTFSPDEIKSVAEEPAGQCMIYLSDGTIFQPVESVEEVIRLWESASS